MESVISLGVTLFLLLIIMAGALVANYFIIRFAVRKALTETWREIRADAHSMPRKEAPKSENDL